ncbi:MAG: 50S ribosomal protein L23 [Phycisphaerales bacterium]|nr:MAG: 50S ribosomal protein L23 [Phycisphaerales bacterium]
MESTTVIRKPLITEKSTFASGEQNRYTFQVDRRADKGQIKRAVEELYGVRVLSVATQNRKGQMRRNRFGYWSTADVKRAIVKVHPDDRIDLF